MNDECLADYKYYFSERFNLFKGDSRQVLPLMKDNSIDSVVCDPPYELGFMGKSWDSTGIANDPQLWKEVLRVLKPGGHLLAFSGSRTYHRMAVAIEDAGFEIRDQIMWVYGSGFPKSHNISKGIDKAAGAERNRDLKWVAIASGSGNYGGGAKGGEMAMVADDVAITDEFQQWQGWGTALKPAHEPIVLARKPLEGTVANNVLTHGTGGLNIDGTRVGTEGGTRKEPSNEKSTTFSVGAYLNQKAGTPIDAGRFPANFIHDGSDEVVALFPDGKSVSGKKQPNNTNNKVYSGTWNSQPEKIGGFDDSVSAARFFYCAKASKRDRNEGLDGFEAKRDHDGRADGGVGGDNPRNRTNDAKLNYHPTVKPTDLMQYLCRLITPPNGTILDPFLGSGSTGKAAMYEGFNFVGIELTQEYLPIAKARIEFALANLDEKLF
jgi:DNA modification methylase